MLVNAIDAYLQAERELPAEYILEVWEDDRFTLSVGSMGVTGVLSYDVE